MTMVNKFCDNFVHSFHGLSGLVKVENTMSCMSYREHGDCHNLAISLGIDVFL